MVDSLTQRLSKLANDNMRAKLKGIRRGLEKESLRISPKGRLSQTDHPKGLGSKLTNPSITTDYSEALLEFITPAFDTADATLNHLDDVHRFTYSQLDDELLWTTSMPCVLESHTPIRLAEYGSSNIAKMKTIYREGLGNRYGRPMQTIAGIHYNFSMPEEFWQYWHQEQQSNLSLQDFKTEWYFALIRNFHRYSWLLLYLFGASPALCHTFVEGRDHDLETLASGTLYLSDATSLRMGDLGYQSKAQEGLLVCYNQLDTYIKSLHGAITTPHPDYQAIGMQNENGEYKQLNTALLQIENEFYSTIRPKRTISSGETALGALRERGVEYIEVRSLDLNPYLPLGIDKTQMQFLDVFLLFCLLSPSDMFDEADVIDNKNNLGATVNHGRNIDLELHTKGGKKKLRTWGYDLLEEMTSVAELLDSIYGGSVSDENSSNDHLQALLKQRDKIVDSSLTPSEKILDDLRNNEIGFYHFAIEQSDKHLDYFQSRPLNEQRQQEFVTAANQSWADQKAIEAQPQAEFADFLADYYAQYNFGTS